MKRSTAAVSFVAAVCIALPVTTAFASGHPTSDGPTGIATLDGNGGAGADSKRGQHKSSHGHHGKAIGKAAAKKHQAAIKAAKQERKQAVAAARAQYDMAVTQAGDDEALLSQAKQDFKAAVRAAQRQCKTTVRQAREDFREDRKNRPTGKRVSDDATPEPTESSDDDSPSPEPTESSDDD